MRFAIRDRPIFLQLIIFLWLVAAQVPAGAASSCSRIFSFNDSADDSLSMIGGRQRPGKISWSTLNRLVPALSHETNNNNLLRILVQGQLTPRGGPDSYQQPLDGRSNGLGGISDSIYLDSFKKRKSGRSLHAPTIFFSSLLLRRTDYFVTLKRAHGHYSPDDLSIGGLPLSFHSRGWTEENAKEFSFWDSEIVFSRNIQIDDYAIGIWIPVASKQAFLDLLATNGIDLDGVSLPIYFSDRYPSFAEISRTPKKKNFVSHTQENDGLHPRIKIDSTIDF